jgi:hypothetical protein
MSDADTKLVLSVKQIRELIDEHGRQQPPIPPAFGLSEHFDRDNILEIAKSQFPRLEAQVAIRAGMEKTKRLLIVVAAVCLMVGSALVVFAPAGKEGISYVVAALLGVLPLGAIGVQEFRMKTAGVISIEGGKQAVK